MPDAPAQPFAHLHVHTEYSLLDGACRIEDLVRRARELGQSSLAISDHGCLFGAVEFYHAARAANVKPILGIEAYMAPRTRHDRTTTGVKDGGYHLLLLAQNLAGYRNLLKLGSIAYLEGFYYKPRIDRQALSAHADGLICTSACLGGEIPSALMADDRKKAREIAEFYLRLFGPERFFIELQRHIPEQERVNPHLIDLADQLGIGLVATNDVHFLLPDDHAHHDALCCISTRKLLTDESRMKYPTELFLKSADQMYAAWDHPRWHEACRRSAQIADRCELQLDFKTSHAPAVKVEFEEEDRSRVEKSKVEKSKVESRGADADNGPSTFDLPTSDSASSPAPLGSTPWYQSFCDRFQLRPFDALADQTPADQIKNQCDHALRRLAEAGAVWRYGPDGITPDIRARLDRELNILADKNISAYFLIVWDFVNQARRRGIPANARGSGVGTMVGYCLGLSNACPVRYGLLFERFTDPDRSEYPDIDIDICQDGRQQVIDYVRQKYGHVAQIITFGTLKARNAIRDVGRVLNVPLPEVDRLCKLVGDKLGTTIQSALDSEPDLKALYQSNPQTRQLLDTALRLEGLSRHAGVHAAGVIIATQPLDNIVPLYKPSTHSTAASPGVTASALAAPNLPSTLTGGATSGGATSGGTTSGGTTSGGEQIVTQWDGPTCEKVGLLKMDFLGLRTLSIIERARQLIRATLDDDAIRRATAPKPGASGGSGPDSASVQAGIANRRSPILPDPPDPPDPLDLDRLTYDDPRVLDLFKRGETAGVFQFESGGMRNLLMAMKPDRLEDLIAANALFRPGPMELIGVYNDRKHGRAVVPKVHPIVDRFTSETYGVMVYQEQVMQIVHALGGMPLRAAYTLIKNISKKKKDAIDAARPKFVQGAQTQGLSKEKAEELFDLILKFAGYGFNKSHSTGYAIVAYQTAYLKTFFPVQYMAAVLSYESVSTEKVVEYVAECRNVMRPGGKRGIDVRPPDINLSDTGFTVVYDDAEPRDPDHGHIRFGLTAVKGVGDKAVRAVIDTRQKGGPFTSLYDFCERAPLACVNRATIEALIKCGAFDSVHGIEQRAALMSALDSAVSAGQRAAADRDSGQLSMFGSLADDDDQAAPVSGKHSAIGRRPSAIALPRTDPWSHTEQLQHEKSVLGFYLSSHPLEQHRDALARFASATVAQAKRLAADVELVLGGMLTRIRPTLVKNGRSAGQKMAMLTIEDATGSIDAVVFSDAYAVHAPLLEADRIVFVRGKIDRRREEPSVIIHSIVPVQEAARTLTRAVRIVLRAPGENPAGVTAPTAPALPTAAVQCLNKLRDLLRQSSARVSHGPSAATPVEVLFEVHESGRVVTLRPEGTRIVVDPELPQRIAVVLDEPDPSRCCQLVGPTPIAAQRHANLLYHSTADPQQAPLARSGSQPEFCASIDRY